MTVSCPCDHETKLHRQGTDSHQTPLTLCVRNPNLYICTQLNFSVFYLFKYDEKLMIFKKSFLPLRKIIYKFIFSLLLSFVSVDDLTILGEYKIYRNVKNRMVDLVVVNIILQISPWFDKPVYPCFMLWRIFHASFSLQTFTFLFFFFFFSLMSVLHNIPLGLYLSTFAAAQTSYVHACILKICTRTYAENDINNELLYKYPKKYVKFLIK